MGIPGEYEYWSSQALKIFSQKRQQYGESWQVLSLPSLIDLLVIKAHRLQTLYGQSRQHSPATGEKPLEDWLSLINYGVLALAALHKQGPHEIEKTIEQHLSLARQTLAAKNTDYGDAWRLMRPLAFAEFILMKLERIRSMDRNPEAHKAAIQDNLVDIINYAILFLCRYGDEVCSR